MTTSKTRVGNKSVSIINFSRDIQGPNKTFFLEFVRFVFFFLFPFVRLLLLVSLTGASAFGPLPFGFPVCLVRALGRALAGRFFGKQR